MASQPQPSGPLPPTGKPALYKELDTYDWAADTEFQSGLQAILGSTADPTRTEHLTLRARCFYFSRKRNVHIDFNDYLSWRASQTQASVVNGIANDTAELGPAAPVERRGSVAQQYDGAPESAEPPTPYPTSFEQIVELISTGQPIPGIKDVPNTVLEGQASQTSTARRKKPWENDNEITVEPETLGGTALNA